jgi:hypothetical protein
MYAHMDFARTPLELKLGEDISNLTVFQLGRPWEDWNDHISSVKAKLVRGAKLRKSGERPS